MFTRTAVGYDNRGRLLHEYRLDGTPFVIVRMNPETSEGWSIHDLSKNENVSDAWLLRDAKALASKLALTID